MDDVLESFLAAPDEQRSEEHLGDLLTRHAAPLVRRIVSRRLGSSASDVDDVCAQVMLQLLLRLRRERMDDNLSAIDVFDGYVATAAHHACDNFIRAKYPLRWRLRCRVRYVLEHDPRFAIWRAANGALVCGRVEWRSRQASGATAPDAPAGIPKQDVGELLARLFDQSGSPLELTAVVDAAAAAWGVPRFQHDAGYALENVAAREPRADAALDQRERLARVWAQVCGLPVRQRHALLLNLKADAITLFLTTGAASLRDIAGALELPIEQFVAVWNDLPLPDNTLAARLGCTRQQVINLRMSARKRLANRLAPTANIGAAGAL
jgi:DNA-directed RNA polymerase specialized sigma24 family protein